MRIREPERGKGRDDYRIRAVWNSMLAGVVYQHPTIESMRRDLQRNAQVRELCGFDPYLGERAVPPAYVYTRFCQKLMEHADEVEKIFLRLVEETSTLLPDFGRILAIDSKAIDSLARGQKRDEAKKSKKPDGRRDTDADFGMKTYRGHKKDGTLWQKIVSWFGYKLHLVVDATYELPVTFSVTKASVSDVKEGHKLLDQRTEQQPKIMECCEVLQEIKAMTTKHYL